LLIGGEWVEASDGATFGVHDPADGSMLRPVASASTADGKAAVDAAAAAASGWAGTSPRDRADVLRRAYEGMRARQASLAELLVRENGKPLAEATAELAQAADFLRWFSEEAVRISGTVAMAPAGDKRIVVTHQPVGVSLCVTPWNFPAAMVTRKVAPAIAAGCTVILKPAPDTPLTALAVAELLVEAGLPPGVLNVLPSDRSAEVVATILADGRVRKLSFTGSTETGRKLLALAAETVVNPSMELGGNAPFVVFADADLDAAVAGAVVAKTRNAGQSCNAANRFYVAAPVADAFTERLAEALGALRVGNGLEPGVEVGPLINAGARDKVSALTQSAVDAGGKVAVGGRARRGEGFFFEPTLITDVAPDAPILGREVFGPVAPVVAFEDVEDAVRMANDTIHGLVAFLYTRDVAAGMRIASSIETGMVGINRPVVADPAAPFGGVKQSGLGREGGPHGIEEFLEPQYVAADW
jgi:succinate-semialdehyde dehydrogenase / glutarate-semialdehyde dehydrogenase